MSEELLSPIGSSEVEKTYFERILLLNGNLKIAEFVALKWLWTRRIFFSCLYFWPDSARNKDGPAYLIASLFSYGSGTKAPNHHLLERPSLFTIYELQLRLRSLYF